MTARTDRWQLRRCRIEELAGLSPPEQVDGPCSVHLHRRSGQRVFVKAMNGALPGFRNEVAAARMLAGLPAVVPVVDIIADPAAGCAIVFAYCALRPLGEDPVDVEALGQALRTLHDHGARVLANDPAAFGAPPLSLAETLRHSLSCLPRNHPESARLTQLVAHAESVGTLARYAGSDVLVHGDFGRRNVGRRPDGGICIFDFEHARIGHPIMEFAKLWDRELADSASRAAFLVGYGKNCAGLPLTDRILWPVRLWAAIGIMIYCSRVEDASFLSHGQSLLDRLQAEIASDD